MRIYDHQDKVWLERDGIDAQEMLNHESGRYSKTDKAQAAPAEAETAMTATPPGERKKRSKKKSA